ncbi:hypothetical protein Moror_9537 [Moniliophthora roreri MCA 2997]|uniref:Uncharacterized protein n=1 Tax=Moniliophthora roreri (strain MCA 2997) TaxID=1381753 RepID=V2XEC3_MONRO|nr:hypothetical protein Moror_9537 [Moniliophthora roreri MCA 2997]KAI3599202.1 hypothetical protein WG66_013432 [Moniliophthora roreri]
MEGLASAFSGFPGFSPMMMMNRSETCATRRLCQCTGFGISMNDVTQKFNRNPEYATDLSRMDFFARKAVIEQVEKWRDENENKPELIHENKWTPILYICEIVKSSPKHDVSLSPSKPINLLTESSGIGDIWSLRMPRSLVSSSS